MIVIDNKNFAILNTLGSKPQGNVLRVRSFGNEYALKQMKVLNPSELENFKKMFKLSQLRIPNILKGVVSHYNPSEEVFKFTTEIMETDLFKLINERKRSICFSEFLPIFREIFIGISSQLYYIKKEYYIFIPKLYIQVSLVSYKERQQIIET